MDCRAHAECGDGNGNFQCNFRSIPRALYGHNVSGLGGLGNHAESITRMVAFRDTHQLNDDPQRGQIKDTWTCSLVSHPILLSAHGVHIVHQFTAVFNLFNFILLTRMQTRSNPIGSTRRVCMPIQWLAGQKSETSLDYKLMNGWMDGQWQ